MSKQNAENIPGAQRLSILLKPKLKLFSPQIFTLNQRIPSSLLIS